MSKEKSMVDVAIEEAAKMGNVEVRNASSVTVSDLVRTNPVTPVFRDEEGRPLPKAEVKRQVEAYCHEQKIGMLAHSIGLGLGVDFPIGFTIRLEKCEEFLKDLKIIIKRTAGDFATTVEVAGGSYNMVDTDRHALALRAIHFALLRQDPDTDEFVQRRLFAEVNQLEATMQAAEESGVKH